MTSIPKWIDFYLLTNNISRKNDIRYFFVAFLKIIRNLQCKYLIYDAYGRIIVNLYNFLKKKIINK